jgi:hypothetical protein
VENKFEWINQENEFEDTVKNSIMFKSIMSNRFTLNRALQSVNIESTTELSQSEEGIDFEQIKSISVRYIKKIKQNCEIMYIDAERYFK